MVWVVECQEATKPVANLSQVGIKTLNFIMTLIKQCLEMGKHHNSIFEWLTDILTCSHDDLPSRMLANLMQAWRRRPDDDGLTTTAWRRWHDDDGQMTTTWRRWPDDDGQTTTAWRKRPYSLTTKVWRLRPDDEGLATMTWRRGPDDDSLTTTAWQQQLGIDNDELTTRARQRRPIHSINLWMNPMSWARTNVRAEK